MASRLTLSIIFLFFMMTISPMSKNFDNELEDEPLILASSESGFEWEWADSISSDNYDDIYAMTVDEEGNTYVGGAYRGQTVNVQANSSQNPNAPSGDPLFAKFDVDGNVVWLKSFGVTNSSLAIYGLSMSLSGNVIACGGFSQNFTIDGFSVESLISGGGVGNSWLAEFDEDGSLQWIKSMQNAAICVGQGGNSAISVSEVDGSIYTYGFSAVFHNAGPQNISIYSGVEVNNSNDFNNYNHYVSTLSYLIKFDSNGNYQWRQHMFCGTYYCSSDLDLGISEGEEIIYVTGHVYAHLSFNNSATELWTTSTDSFLHTEFYVAAFDSQFGNLKWANNASASASFPSNGNGAGVGLSPEEPSISVDGLGNAIIGGNFYSNMTFQTQPPTQLNVSWDVTGCFSKHDAFVAKIDAFGEWKWARDVGSNSSCVEIINDLETNYEGSILLTGGFMGRSGQNILEIGNHSFTTAMSGSYDYDIFIAGMDPSGNWSMAEVTEGSSNNYALNVGFLNNTHGYIGAEIYDSITYGQTTLSEPSTNANNWIFVGQFSFENMSVDEDLDGVMNDDDECPETPLNTLVDYDGCAADFELVYVEEDLWGTGGSIAIDSNDEVYISAPYYSGKLNLFQLNTSTNAISWDKHVVIDGLDRDYGHDTSLYFDSNDIPHIAFHMLDNRSMEYTVLNETVWEFSVIDEIASNGIANVGQQHDIVVDSENNPHIIYNDGIYGNSGYVYSTLVDGVWVSNYTFQSMSGFGKNSMAIDSNDNLHVIYTSNDGSIIYATNEDGYWDLNHTLGIQGDLSNSYDFDDSEAAISIGADGDVHMSYCLMQNGGATWDVGNGSLMYSKKENGQWMTETIETGIDCSFHNGERGHSILVDGYGFAHILYYVNQEGTGAPDKLVYSTNTKSSWDTYNLLEKLDSIHEQTSMAVDSHNNIHLIFEHRPTSPNGYVTTSYMQINRDWTEYDDDLDGVPDGDDQCPNTPEGVSVNQDGCSVAQLDEDGDGVGDYIDQCPNTPAGEIVDFFGCSQSQLDDDGDGVMNDVDQCPNTPSGETVDAIGCSQSQLDDDGDGIMNDVDQCPNTAYGINVGLDGCNHPPVCTFSYEDNSATQTVFAQDLPLGTGSQVAVLTLSPGNYNFNVECNDPEFDLIQMTIVFDNGNGHMFTDSPLISGPLPVTLSDGLSLSKTITYDWIDGANSGTYQVDISIVGDDDANSSGSSWLPGFGIELLLCALFIAFILVNRRE